MSSLRVQSIIEYQRLTAENTGIFLVSLSSLYLPIIGFEMTGDISVNPQIL